MPRKGRTPGCIKDLDGTWFEVAEYRIRCYPTANVFRRGHRLRVDVTSSSFPRFSRNLNTGEDVGTSTRMEIARQTILHTDAYPSHVLLPVIPS